MEREGVFGPCSSGALPNAFEISFRPDDNLKPQKKLAQKNQIIVLERDEAPEAAISPLWDSFCGTSVGAWQGVATAVSPVTGEREAVGLVDEKVVVESIDEVTADDGSVRSVVKTRTKIIKKDILALATYTVERRTGGRAGGGGTDRLTRRTVRSPTTAGLAAAAAAAAAEAEAGGAEEGDDIETPITSPSSPSFDGVNDALRAKEPGLVIFDGGTCSRGPLNLLGLPPLSTASSSSSSMSRRGENDGVIDVDAEREALERLVALSPSASALESEDKKKEKEKSAAAETAESSPSDDGGDWSSLEGGRESDGNFDDIEILDIAASPDVGEDPEATVSVIESCLAWGGEQRLRVQLTLSVADGESSHS